MRANFAYINWGCASVSNAFAQYTVCVRTMYLWFRWAKIHTYKHAEHYLQNAYEIMHGPYAYAFTLYGYAESADHTHANCEQMLSVHVFKEKNGTPSQKE